MTLNPVEQPTFDTKVPEFAVAKPASNGRGDTLILFNGTWQFNGTYYFGDNDP